MNARSYVIALLLAAANALSVEAGPKPFPEFSAKRVKPPVPGSSKRITIQIEPAAPAPQSASQPQSGVAAESAPSGGLYGWFWEEVSTDATPSGPGRLEHAMSTLQGNGGAGGPRLQELQNIAMENGIPILTSTVGTEVSPALVLAVIAVESAGRPDAVSSMGAQGLMQLMPDTAERFGVNDALVPAQNIAGGVQYLDWLMEKFDGDPILVLAGYNAGEGSVRKHGGVPPYPETRDYVPKVLSAFQVARGLCKTPPELISDGCVFVAMN